MNINFLREIEGEAQKIQDFNLVFAKLAKQGVVQQISSLFA